MTLQRIAYQSSFHPCYVADSAPDPSVSHTLHSDLERAIYTKESESPESRGGHFTLTPGQVSDTATSSITDTPLVGLMRGSSDAWQWPALLNYQPPGFSEPLLHLLLSSTLPSTRGFVQLHFLSFPPHPAQVTLRTPTDRASPRLYPNFSSAQESAQSAVLRHFNTQHRQDGQRKSRSPKRHQASLWLTRQ
jgi:hypothetical protein